MLIQPSLYLDRKKRKRIHFIIQNDVDKPDRVVQELYRILMPGGLVYMDVPFLLGYHPDPVDYWRFSLSGLEKGKSLLLVPHNIYSQGELKLHLLPDPDRAFKHMNDD